MIIGSVKKMALCCNNINIKQDQKSIDLALETNKKKQKKQKKQQKKEKRKKEKRKKGKKKREKEYFWNQ